MPKQEILNGLVLTGGGARAAYQVGALRAISDITKFENNPFKIISGISAGAINGVWLASRCETFDKVTKSMWSEWANIKTEKIFKTDIMGLSGIASRWIRDRVFGGMISKQQINYLLDTSPLYEFIKSRINFDHLNSHVKNGLLHGIAVTAANYRTGQSIAFYAGSNQIKDWQKLNRLSRRTDLAAEHVMASAAIPIFCPPIRIGDGYYGDGIVRLNAPFSPCIHMGAHQLLIIGGRGPVPMHPTDPLKSMGVSIGEIAGTILSGLFFDSLESDVDRAERINRAIVAMSPQLRRSQPDRLRNIPILYLRPSKRLDSMSAGALARLPHSLRFLLKGIGISEEKGRDLLSFLSFEPSYLRALLELGYEDTMQRKDAVRDFFFSKIQ